MLSNIEGCNTKFRLTCIQSPNISLNFTCSRHCTKMKLIKRITFLGGTEIQVPLNVFTIKLGMVFLIGGASKSRPKENDDAQLVS